MQNQASLIFKIALNRVLTLPDYSTRRELLKSSGIIDLQNNRVCKQFKHWKYRISVPMLYISFWGISTPLFLHEIWRKVWRLFEKVIFKVICWGNRRFLKVIWKGNFEGKFAGGISGAQVGESPGGVDP